MPEKFTKPPSWKYELDDRVPIQMEMKSRSYNYEHSRPEAPFIRINCDWVMGI